MDIIIISEFCEDFSKADNDRFFYLAKMLADNNDVEIITSNFRHTTKCQRNKPATTWSFKITFIEEPGYQKNVCLKRFYSHHIWGKNVENYIIKRKKPDVIYCAVPSLTGPNLISKYCKKNNIRFIIDVQDLWPEAFRMVINIPIISNMAFIPFMILANNIYKRADEICAVSDTYCHRAMKVNKKCQKSITVFLGTELSTFDSYASQPSILKKENNEIFLAYCGTLGSSYDISCVIDALAIIRNEKIRFIVIGDGPRLNEFKNYAKNKGINATFTGRLPYNQMCGLLKICDITVNPIVHMAAQSIINKHADYAASGLPVISTQESNEYKNLIDKYQMGFNCRNNDAEDLANKLKFLIENKNVAIVMGKNARKCAEENFDRSFTYQKLKKIILNSMENV